MGIDASLDGRNDLVAEGYKISGNAECVRRSVSGANAMLHHGTILFSADMSKLAGALRVDPEKIKSKGIASVRGRVKNITGLEGYRGPEDVEDFISHLFGSVSDKRPEGFSEEEARAIAARRDGKFATWEWNFGASPAFDFENKRRFSFGTVTAAVLCRGGRIEDVKFYGDFFGTADKELLENVLTGTKYDREKIFQKLEDNRALVESCISGALPQDIADLLFK